MLVYIVEELLIFINSISFVVLDTFTVTASLGSQYYHVPNKN